MKHQLFKYVLFLIILSACSTLKTTKKNEAHSEAVKAPASISKATANVPKVENPIVPKTEVRRKNVTKEYFKDGGIKYEFHYKNGVLDGETKEFNKAKKLTIWTYKSDTLTEGKSTYPNGRTEALYKYEKGVREGKSYGYFESGKTKVTWNYVKGILNGVTTEYFEDGIISKELLYDNGYLNGITKQYDRSGKLKYEWNYKNDKLDGVSKEYYPNGKLKERSIYLDNKLKGITIN